VTLRHLAEQGTDRNAFYAAVLEVLRRAARARGGVLYLHQDGQLQRAAMAGELEQRPPVLDSIAVRYFDVQSEVATECATQTPAMSPTR
jgi:hypothetical protein